VPGLRCIGPDGELVHQGFGGYDHFARDDA
jgi:hypothetical protein